MLNHVTVEIYRYKIMKQNYNSQQNNNPKRFLDYSLFNRLKKQFKKLHYIKRNKKDFKPSLSPEQQALGFNISFTSDNRPYLPSSSNKVLISQLNQLGFFDVFSTNHSCDKLNSFGVYLYQVILFFEFGIDWVRRQFKMDSSSMEIHHINSNVCDNQPSNLSVVSAPVHSFISTLQVGSDPLDRKYLSRKAKDFKVFNNEGVLLKGKAARSFLTSLVIQTLKNTKLWLKANILAIQNSLESQDIFQQALISPFHPLSLSWNHLLSVYKLSAQKVFNNLRSAASLFLRRNSSFSSLLLN